jgi:hypothetical protein
MNGAFLLHRGGALLAAGPEGLYRRDTGLFNTITVDGRGQTGDSTVWLPDYFPVERIPGPPSMEIRDGDLFIRAEFGLSYLLHLGVMRCERNLCLRQDGTILGIDRVKLRTKRNIEWRFHSHSPIQSDDPHAHSFSIGDPGDTARLDVCRPLEALAAREMPEFLPAYPNGGTRLHSLVITHAGEEALFVWCISFDPSSRIAMVSESGEDQVRFRTAGGVGWVYDPSLGLRKVTEG